jgi:hypothetical protein
VSGHRETGGKKAMGYPATVKKPTYGEAVAQRLAHDSKLMASIDQAMVDVANNRMLTLEEFAKAVDEKIENQRSIYQSRSAD